MLTLVILASLFGLLYIYDWYYRIFYHFRARARGCAGTPRVGLKDLWLPLGIKQALKGAVAYKKSTALDFVEGQFYEYDRQTMQGWLSGNWAVMTCEPEVIKTVLATNFKDFSLGERYPMFYPLLGNGIFTLSGEGWKHSRTLLRPQFARDQISHLSSIQQHVDLLIDKLLSETRAGRTPDAQFLFFCLTLDTASEFLFGSSTDSLRDSSLKVQGPTRAVSGPEFGKAFGEAQTMLGFRFIAGGLYRLVDTPGFRTNIDICKNFIDSFVQQALASPMEKDDVDSKFVFIRELTKETRDPVVIRDQAFNILLAGRDTTAATMSFMACYLGRYKHIWRKLRSEVLEHFGPDGSTISFESLKRCKYLNNVIHETLRLNPIVPLNFRYATRDTTLPTGGGPNQDQKIFLPKGSPVFYSVHAMHRHPKFWGPDAGTFNPDRWDDVKGHSWEFLPFNGGPRICLGQQFALTEMACTWVRICQRVEDFDVLVPGEPEKIHQHLTVTASVAGGVPSRWAAV